MPWEEVEEGTGRRDRSSPRAGLRWCPAEAAQCSAPLLYMRTFQEKENIYSILMLLLSIGGPQPVIKVLKQQLGP